MKILFISNLYPPYDLGGLEQRCQEVAERLRLRGHTVRVLTSVANGNGHVVEEGVTRSLFLQADLHYYQPMDFFWKRRRQELHNVQELRKTIDQFMPDVILIWGMWNLSRAVAFHAEQWLPGRVAYNIASYWPIEKDIHTEYWRLPANHWLSEWIKRPLRNLALNQLQQGETSLKLGLQHAFCASEYVRDTLLRAGVLPQESVVIYPGIDPDPLILRSAEDGDRNVEILRLLYFGSLVHHKGVHTAIEALGLLKQRCLVEGIELTILGSGHPDYENYLRKLAQDFGVQGKVHFVGKVPRQEIPTWLKQFDVFLFTSIWPEPIAATVMEAMVAGLLVIGTEVGGQAEMLCNGVNSLTFEPDNALSLAKQIASVRDDRAVRNRLAQAGQQMVLDRFTLDCMVENIENHLFTILHTARKTES